MSLNVKFFYVNNEKKINTKIDWHLFRNKI